MFLLCLLSTAVQPLEVEQPGLHDDSSVMLILVTFVLCCAVGWKEQEGGIADCP